MLVSHNGFYRKRRSKGQNGRCAGYLQPPNSPSSSAHACSASPDRTICPRSSSAVSRPSPLGLLTQVHNVFHQLHAWAGQVASVAFCTATITQSWAQYVLSSSPGKRTWRPMSAHSPFGPTSKKLPFRQPYTYLPRELSPRKPLLEYVDWKCTVLSKNRAPIPQKRKGKEIVLREGNDTR